MFCYFGEASRLWQVSNDAKHIISGILSRIPKGSLSITKDMIVGILPLFWLEDKKKKLMCNTGLTGAGGGGTALGLVLAGACMRAAGKTNRTCRKGCKLVQVGAQMGDTPQISECF